MKDKFILTTATAVCGGSNYTLERDKMRRSGIAAELRIFTFYMYTYMRLRMENHFVSRTTSFSTIESEGEDNRNINGLALIYLSIFPLISIGHSIYFGTVLFSLQ